MLCSLLWIYFVSLLIYLGVHCELDINECESSPCQHGGTCENLHGSYTCHCPTVQDASGQYYGGPDCTEVLRGCEEQICSNGGTCVPYITESKHNHSCICAAGFTGPDCQIKTTFSFNRRTVFPIRNVTIQPQRGSTSSMSMSFCTVQTNAVLLSFGAKPTSFTLDIQNSFLFLAFFANTKLRALLHLSHNVSDNNWHTVEIVIADKMQLRLLDPSCDTTCVTQSSYDGPSTILVEEMLVGSVLSAGTSEGINGTYKAESLPRFVGCLRDIRVASASISEEDGKLVGAEVGCNRYDHCENFPCGNRGKCINLWTDYYCDCYRPYRGTNCATEYEAAGYGQGNVSSYAIFKIKKTEDITLSAFVRVEQDSGLLFALENNTSYDITVCIEAGRLILKAGGDISKGVSYISDFHFHLVSLKVTGSSVELSVSSSAQAEISMDISRGRTTNALYVGGLADPLETMQKGGYFKGCIQDLRIDDQALEFFPSSKSNEDPFLNNVAKGCTINCSPHTACEQNWCRLAKCPLGFMCQHVPSGYECIASALFNGEGHGIIFRSNGKITRDLTNMTLGFRTPKSGSVLLHASREPETVTVSIHEEKLHFNLQSGNGLSAVNLLSVESVSDSQWHTVTLSMTAPGLETSTWQMEIDGKPEMIISSLATGNLNFLKEGTDIYVGIHTNDSKRHFIGCLGTVLLEGIHLPYLADSDYITVKPQREQFVKISAEKVVTGCLESDPCASQPCMNGGTCTDVFTHPGCTCPTWKTGLFCEADINECLSRPCVHGNCSAGPGGYKCECVDGYSGTNCDISSCYGHLCANGATCIAGTTGYLCLCPANITGQHCSVFSQSETSSLSSVRMINRMPSIFCGDEKKNITCYNFSNCTAVNGLLGCSCIPGFVGERCEIDYDECQSNPCLNGGICQNLPNRFNCICDLNFAGEFCEVDVSDLSFYVSMLLWQNLFQLLSYLILRMDDEPGVDWGEEEYDEH